jgi:hypothetical protein
VFEECRVKRVCGQLTGVGLLLAGLLVVPGWWSGLVVLDTLLMSIVAGALGSAERQQVMTQAASTLYG